MGMTGYIVRESKKTGERSGEMSGRLTVVMVSFPPWFPILQSISLLSLISVLVLRSAPLGYHN